MIVIRLHTVRETMFRWVHDGLKMLITFVKMSLLLLSCSFGYKLDAVCLSCRVYEGASKSFRTESITKYTLTTINTRWKATQRVMAAKLATLTHRIVIQLHLVAESCTIFSSRSRRRARKLLDTPSYCIILQQTISLTHSIEQGPCESNTCSASRWIPRNCYKGNVHYPVHKIL
jgi:hypothetical protein